MSEHTTAGYGANTDQIQPTFFGPVLVYASRSEGDIQARFLEFHEANPEVYAQMRRMAFELKGGGAARYSIRGIYETLRFRRTLETGGDAGFKLNNDFCSRYARMLMEQEPELAGEGEGEQPFFHIRQLKS